MDLAMLTNFFMWCTIISAGIMCLSMALMLFLSDLAFKIHSSMFGISREAFNNAVYTYFANFKIMLITFNLIPYLALLAIS